VSPSTPTEPLHWQKSSLSGASGCVETAAAGGLVAVRDSKDPAGPVLRYTPHEWEVFVAGVKRGEFDHLARL
jgi:predicted secreted Zn-dependent protease